MQQYMQPGEHKGIKYGTEVRQLVTGELIINAIIVDGLPYRWAAGDATRKFADIEAAFNYGAELARTHIDGQQG